MARSLNRAQLIGNLTRDPELRYTPNGTAVCSFGVATNRTWVTDTGEKREEADFHNIVAWNKLAEICSQLLVKGRKVYVEGRISTRTWTAQDGSQKFRTEVIIGDMILLDSRESARRAVSATSNVADAPPDSVSASDAVALNEEKELIDSAPAPAKKEKKGKEELREDSQDVNPDDIPF